MARTGVSRVAADCRQARIGAGLSLRFVARAVGTSHGRVGRFERGEVRSTDTAFLGAYCAVVGLDLSLRAYPAGDPMRDAAHTGLLGRFRQELHPSLRWDTEVPIPLPGDLRAWDAVVRGADWRVRVEAETHLADGQALERRLALKHRDGGPGHLVLLVADTRSNRLALMVLREHVRELLPCDARQILAALRDGREPPGSGIVVL